MTIHEELATALGPDAPAYRTVAKWAERFREGREDVNDDLRSGRPLSELTDENIELVRQVICFICENCDLLVLTVQKI